MKSFLSVVFMICCYSIARADNSSNLISSAELTGSVPKKKIMGPLGCPLGEYMTVEGRPCAVGFGGTVQFLSLEDISKFGVQSLEVHKVNGIELRTPVIISFLKLEKFTPSDHYSVRGYQTGEFGPADPDPENPDATAAQTNFHFSILFVPTKDLTHEINRNAEPAAGASRLEDKAKSKR